MYPPLLTQDRDDSKPAIPLAEVARALLELLAQRELASLVSPVPGAAARLGVAVRRARGSRRRRDRSRLAPASGTVCRDRPLRRSVSSPDRGNTSGPHRHSAHRGGTRRQGAGQLDRVLMARGRVRRAGAEGRVPRMPAAPGRLPRRSASRAVPVADESQPGPGLRAQGSSNFVAMDQSGFPPRFPAERFNNASHAKEWLLAGRHRCRG